MVLRSLEAEYRLNVPALRSWLKSNGSGAKERLCGAIGKSHRFIELLLQNGNLPTGRNLFALAEAMGVRVEDLAIRVSKKKSA
jgi:hypothetical protein